MTAINFVNYYEILEVLPKASDTEIRTAYKKKALENHPDKASQNNLTVNQATELFTQVQEAYETLSNPQKRSLYDSKRNILLGKFESFNTSFFENDLFSFMYAPHYRSTHHPKSKREDDDDATLFPKSINQEIHNILDDDSSETLDKILKNQPLEKQILESILYYSCHQGKFNIVKYLIEVRCLNPHLKVNDGLSFTGPIFKAAAGSGNFVLVEYLLEVHHVDIESQGLSAGTRNTALSKATSKGHTHIVEYLITKGANLNPEISNRTLLDLAIHTKKVSLVRLLVEAGTKIGYYHLENALEKGDLDIVQYLLQKKPHIKSKAHEYTASPACNAVKSGNVVLVKYLEENEGLDLLEKHQSWDDPIALLMAAAAQSGSVEMMRFLLDERGFNETVMDNPKYISSILHEAVYHKWSRTQSEMQNSLKLVQFLIEERKFILTKNDLKCFIAKSAEYSGIEINSYLHSCFYESDLPKKYLLLSIANHGLKSLSIADLFKTYNSKIIKKGRYHDFSVEVHYHIKEREISIDQLRTSCLENRQMMGDALCYYARYDHHEGLSALSLLLELGADINSEDGEGIAAVHTALSYKRDHIVQFFIDHKADLSKKNKKGRTAEDILRSI